MRIHKNTLGADVGALEEKRTMSHNQVIIIKQALTVVKFIWRFAHVSALELREDIHTVLEPNMVVSMEPMVTIPEGKRES